MQKKLLALFICFATIPIILIYSVFSHIFSERTERNFKTLYSTDISNAARTAEHYFNESLELSMYPLIEPNLYLFYTADPMDENFSKIIDNANTILSSSPYISGGIRGVTLLRTDNISLNNHANYSYSTDISADDIEKSSALNGKSYWDVQIIKGSYVIYITRMIRMPQNFSQTLGYVKTSASINELANTLRSSGLDQDVSYFIITDDFIPILSTNKGETSFEPLEKMGLAKLQLLATNKESTIKSDDCFISAKPISSTPFLICSVVQTDFLSNHPTLNDIFLPISLLTFVFFLLLAIVFSKQIAKPMADLGHKMNAISAGDFSVRANVKGNDEISLLTEQFNQMSEHLDYLYNKVYLSEIELNKAQLIALQSQIRPHFLYNTIDTIYWMAQIGNTQVISQIASNMSRLFRLTITPDNQNLISLNKELEHLNCYMEIQKVRYGESLYYTLNCDIHLENIRVLKLLLQPLVENALTHGYKDQEYVEVQVQIYTDDQYIWYEVRNSGTPISIPYLDKILNSPDEKYGGFAIRNINKRLKLQYGDGFRMEYGLDGEFSFFKIHQPKSEFTDKEKTVND